MKPTPFQWLIASKFTFPIWVGLGLYFWFYKLGGDWNALTQDQQVATTILGALFAIPWLVSFPTVFFYEREQRLYAKSAMSPEERWQKKMVGQIVFLVLLAAALLYFGFTSWKNSPDPQPASYKAAGVVGGLSLVAIPAYLKVKAWRIPSRTTEHPVLVSWCLPVPKRETLQVIALPDYCKRVMSAGAVRPPAPSPPIQTEVNT